MYRETFYLESTAKPFLDSSFGLFCFLDFLWQQCKRCFLAFWHFDSSAETAYKPVPKDVAGDVVGLPVAKRSLWQDLPKEIPFEDRDGPREHPRRIPVYPPPDTWLHSFSGITVGNYQESFPIEVRLPDMQIISIQCKVSDTVAAVKDKVASQIDAPPEVMSSMALYYFGCYMDEHLSIGASECPWNGTHLELKNIQLNVEELMRREAVV